MSYIVLPSSFQTMYFINCGSMHEQKWALQGGLAIDCYTTGLLIRRDWKWSHKIMNLEYQDGATRLPVNRNHCNICGKCSMENCCPNPQSTLNVEYQDGGALPVRLVFTADLSSWRPKSNFRILTIEYYSRATYLDRKKTSKSVVFERIRLFLLSPTKRASPPLM